MDPANNRVYVMDAGAGKIAGVNLTDGKLSGAWTGDQRTLSFTSLVGPANNRVLIGTNIPVKFFKRLKSYNTEQAVWRNAATGATLATASVFSKMTPGILVTPGYGGLQYFLTYDGHVISLQVSPTALGTFGTAGGRHSQLGAVAAPSLGGALTTLWRGCPTR